MKKLCIFMSLVLATLSLGSCAPKEYVPSRVEDNLTEYSVLDDNYRNFYEIYVGAFRDSNGDGIGDLNGVTEKLDYIKDLGYTGIWLMPINPSPSYHKYDVINYYNVDKQYGSVDDLKRLISECHKRDIKLILDLVLNHSSTKSAYFQKACMAHFKELKGSKLTAEDEIYKDFYTFFDNKNEIPGGVSYNLVPGKGFYYECNFSTEMPEFNCDSTYVHEEFKKIIKYYLDMGIDGFRLDAVKYFYFNNSKKNIEFLSLINKWTKDINPKAYIVGECWDGYSTIEKYYTSGIDSFFNFSIAVTNPYSGVMNGVNLNGASLGSYWSAMQKNSEIVGDSAGIPAPFINNHDTPRFTSSGNPNKTKYQYACLQMLNGASFTYYGDEVGMVGNNSKPNPDQNVRTPIKWGEANNKGDCKPVAGVTAISYPYPSVKEQMEDANSLYSYYKQVLRVRNQNPEIARGRLELIEKNTEDKSLLFISKEYNGSKIGIIFNFDQEKSVVVDYKKHGFSKINGQIRIDNESYVTIEENEAITMPAASIVIVK